MKYRTNGQKKKLCKKNKYKKKKRNNCCEKTEYYVNIRGVTFIHYRLALVVWGCYVRSSSPI